VLAAKKKYRIFKTMFRILFLKRRIREFRINRLRGRLRTTFKQFVAAVANQKYGNLVRRCRMIFLWRKSWKALRYWTQNKKLEKQIFAHKILGLSRKRISSYFQILKAIPFHNRKLLKKALIALLRNRDRKLRLRCGHRAIEKKIIESRLAKWKIITRMTVFQAHLEHKSKQRIIKTAFTRWNRSWNRFLTGRYLSVTLEKTTGLHLKRLTFQNMYIASQLALFSQNRINQQKVKIFKSFFQTVTTNKRWRFALGHLASLRDVYQARFQKKHALVVLRIWRFYSTKLQEKNHWIQVLFIRALKHNMDESRAIRQRLIMSRTWKLLSKATLLMRERHQNIIIALKASKKAKIFEKVKSAVKHSQKSKIQLEQLFSRIDSIAAKIKCRVAMSALKLNMNLHFIGFAATRLRNFFINREIHQKKTALKRIALQFRLDYFRKSSYQKALSMARAFKAWRQVSSERRIADKITLIYVLSLLKKGYFALKTYYLHKKIQHSQIEYLAKHISFRRWQQKVSVNKKTRACLRLVQATMIKQVDAVIRLQKLRKNSILREKFESRAKRIYFGMLLMSFIQAKIFRNFENFVSVKLITIGFQSLKAEYSNSNDTQ